VGFELEFVDLYCSTSVENSISKNDVDSGVVITNCTAYGNYKGLYMDEDDLDGITITNYISANNDYSIEFYVECVSVDGVLPGDEPHTVISYSDFWDGCLGYGFNVSHLLTGPGIIYADPQFVSPAGSNFRLTDSSPCRDSGIDTSANMYGAVIDDFDGVSRPQGLAYDMGAFEYEMAPWSPASIQPLVITSLAKATSLWRDIEPLLEQSEDEVAMAMAEQAQAYIERSASLSNPVYASGGLSKAIALLEEVKELLTA